MPRRNRCVLAGVPCHVTQRGVDRREIFSDDADRETYVKLLRRNSSDAGVSVLAWCLMTNHVHLVTLPAREDSLAILMRRVNGRYAQYYNARHERNGHLWQNRYFACLLGPRHLWVALAYVEQNPMRAGLVASPGDYRWSSAAAHLHERDAMDVVDLNWWRSEYGGKCADWAETLGGVDLDSITKIRQCTHAGRPFGDEAFVESVSSQFGRFWIRGRPKKTSILTSATVAVADQGALFAELG